MQLFYLKHIESHFNLLLLRMKIFFFLVYPIKKSSLSHDSPLQREESFSLLRHFNAHQRNGFVIFKTYAENEMFLLLYFFFTFFSFSFFSSLRWSLCCVKEEKKSINWIKKTSLADAPRWVPRILSIFIILLAWNFSLYDFWWVKKMKKKNSHKNRIKYSRMEEEKSISSFFVCCSWWKLTYWKHFNCVIDNVTSINGFFSLSNIFTGSDMYDWVKVFLFLLPTTWKKNFQL